jgi:PAS domain S-box-containing protein
MHQEALHKILLIDDDREQSAAIQQPLLEAGFNVLVATDGRSALEEARQAHPDLVLSNNLLPGISGGELCRLIRGDAGLTDTPIILYSARRGDYEGAVEGLRAGADDYLEIPVDPALLAAKAARHVARGACVRRQKELEAELRREGELLRALMENVPDAIYFKDRQGRFMRTNSHVPYKGNNLPEDVIGKTDFNFFAYQHARAAFIDEQRIISTGEPIINKEEKEVYPDGSITWLSTTKAPIKDQEGRITGIVGVSRDITERRLAEEALAAEKRLAEEALNASAGIFYLLDEGGNLLRWNRSLERVTGYSPRHLRPMNAFDLFADEERQLVAGKIAEVFVMGEAAFEAHLVARDGSRHPFKMSGRMVRLENGRYMVGTGTDIGESKKADEERERLSSELREALAEVMTLRGMLPVCPYCKNLRSDENYRKRVENYITAHTRAELSHSACPDCYKKEIVPRLRG